MPLSELQNDSKYVWVTVFANKTYHLQPGDLSEDFQHFHDQLDLIRTNIKALNSPQFIFYGILTSKSLLGQTYLTF